MHTTPVTPMFTETVVFDVLNLPLVWRSFPGVGGGEGGADCGGGDGGEAPGIDSVNISTFDHG